MKELHHCSLLLLVEGQVPHGAGSWIPPHLPGRVNARLRAEVDGCEIPVPGATSLPGSGLGTCVSRGQGAGASDMWHAQAVQTGSYHLAEYMCACFVGLAAVSAMLMDSFILFICGKGWQQDTRH